MLLLVAISAFLGSRIANPCRNSNAEASRYMIMHTLEKYNTYHTAGIYRCNFLDKVFLEFARFRKAKKCVK